VPMGSLLCCLSLSRISCLASYISCFYIKIYDVTANAGEYEEVSSDEEEQPKKFIEEDFGYMSDSSDGKDHLLFQTTTSGMVY